jgi:hypothetical protein
MMMMTSRLLLFFFLFFHQAEASRILLTNTSYPHFSTETGALLRWGESQRLQNVHSARWIEVAPRGIRLVASGQPNNVVAGRRWSSPTPCLPIADALCATPRGLLFPSPPMLADAQTLAYYAMSPALAERALVNDSVALAYAMENACALHGAGRVLVDESLSLDGLGYAYTATACDVMEGHLVALYDTVENTVRLAPQTLGPMAYCITLLQAVACLYYATSSSAASSRHTQALVALSLTISNALVTLVHGVPFLLVEDAAFFWCQTLFAAALAAVAMAFRAPDDGADACVHALSATACVVYRSTENAYSGLVCVVLLVRAWTRLLQVTPPHALDCALAWGLVLWQARIGVAPQLGAPRERWPFFAGLALYISLVFARRRFVSSSSSISGSSKKRVD